ncbi:hypothetical protein JCM10908_003427 [Rhodotorula pacifica]|uniref:uncharacterized protein n=1 Tax=Rhodotorula pacifica TaxID=1495444 RepID=UPI0031795085
MLSSCLPSLAPTAARLSAIVASLSTIASSSNAMQLSSSSAVDLLILGSGWTGAFLVPHLQSHHRDISFATTTRDGRDGSIKWAFDPDLDGPEQFAALPRAKTVLIVFPIKGEGGSRRLVRGYEEAIGARARWIQLGSTGIFDGGPTLAALRVQATSSSSAESEKASSIPSDLSSPPPLEWTTRHSPYDKTNARAIAEDELLSQHEETVVLNLSGLWGGSRDPINWLARVAPSEEALEQKGSLHLIHGIDVARAVIAVHLTKTLPTSGPGSSAAITEGDPDKTEIEMAGKTERKATTGQRWVLTDLHLVDWWDLASAHPNAPSPSSSRSSPSEKSPDRALWVRNLMRKHNVRALPRSAAELGRAIDAREFWDAFGLAPIKARWEKGRA